MNWALDTIVLSVPRSQTQILEHQKADLWVPVNYMLNINL